MQADAASGAASEARYDRTPVPSSGKDAATHCTRCTGEPSRASDERTEAHAPTRRSCSSAPSRAKLRPRSESAAVSVRAVRSCTTPMSCQPARSSRTPRNAPICRAPRAPVRRAPQHTTTGSHSSPVRPDTGTVASAPYSTRTPMAAAHAERVGLPPQHEHPEHEAHGDGDDLARPPPGQRTGALARTEAVARPSVAAHPARRPRRGGHAGGSHLMHGPWPSSPM